ncbi:hypothetical protein CAPTEDRAFT_157491 [Capitella teleta]|uniref:Replication termination factor 2 n=1 Tax=Capitella teleta TaxID=283909 RepID=R7TIQ6_CAPTE|nr:hypothetical protein CAPTEDRAFT_157491 [Capitella teleta]|eukprot:ELT93342.1 hypothetical protein CAPTEDRAFT_157491 [Capitella teleta]
MGCDGGTIPRRDELVRRKKKPEKKDKDAELSAKWKHCAISQEPLRNPILACELGRLYNKESVLEFLLDKSKFEFAENFSHIKSLKDVHELNFTDSSYMKCAEKGDAYIDSSSRSKYICPIAGLEMSGKYRFVYLLKCFCVFSERGLREVKSDTCSKCCKKYSSDEIIPLNGTPEEVEKLRSRIEERKLKAKLERRGKKKARAEAAVGVPPTEATDDEPPSKVAKLDSKPSSSSAKAPPKVASKLSLGKTKVKPEEKTIQNDPTKSTAYKSLFNTCEKARNQMQPHWITHNPLYY